MLALKLFWEGVFHFDKHGIVLQHDLMGFFFKKLLPHWTLILPLLDDAAIKSDEGSNQSKIVVL